MHLVSFAVTAAADPAPFDPALLAILSIFGGAALTAAAGFFGAWRQYRREHERWLREQRFDAFTKAVELMSRMEVMHDSFRKPSELDKLRREFNKQSPSAVTRTYLEESTALLAEIDLLMAPIKLLGPDKIADALSAVNDAVRGDDLEARAKARRALVLVMRDTLGTSK